MSRSNRFQNVELALDIVSFCALISIGVLGGLLVKASMHDSPYPAPPTHPSTFPKPGVPLIIASSSVMFLCQTIKTALSFYRFNHRPEQRPLIPETESQRSTRQNRPTIETIRLVFLALCVGTIVTMTLSYGDERFTALASVSLLAIAILLLSHPLFIRFAESLTRECCYSSASTRVREQIISDIQVFNRLPRERNNTSFELLTENDRAQVELVVIQTRLGRLGHIIIHLFDNRFSNECISFEGSMHTIGQSDRIAYLLNKFHDMYNNGSFKEYYTNDEISLLDTFQELNACLSQLGNSFLRHGTFIFEVISILRTHEEALNFPDETPLVEPDLDRQIRQALTALHRNHDRPNKISDIDLINGINSAQYNSVRIPVETKFAAFFSEEVQSNYMFREEEISENQAITDMRRFILRNTTHPDSVNTIDDITFPPFLNHQDFQGFMNLRDRFLAAEPPPPEKSALKTV